MSKVQLKIGDMCITRDSQKWLRTTAGEIPIAYYYKEKYGWDDSTFNAIAWDVQLSAMKAFTTVDQARIQKFVHDWLPTAHRLYRENVMPSPRCKLCGARNEDNIHLFMCLHPEMQKIQEKLQMLWISDTQDHGDSELSNLLDISISSTMVNKSWKPSTNHISRKWAAAAAEQTKIGWIQLLYGRVSNTLIDAMDAHYIEQDLNRYRYNGNRWAKNTIKCTWEIMLELWSTRNEIIYKSDQRLKEEQNREKLETRIRRCYSLQHILTANERNRWFNSSLTDKITEDAHKTTKWLDGVERIIRITKREQKHRPKESAILERFLNIQLPQYQNDHGNPEVENPRAYANEFSPD
jgi:hypothetical protein